jgi:hypothetical protein
MAPIPSIAGVEAGNVSSALPVSLPALYCGSTTTSVLTELAMKQA